MNKNKQSLRIFKEHDAGYAVASIMLQLTSPFDLN